MFGQSVLDMNSRPGSCITGPGIFRPISDKLVGTTVFLDERNSYPVEKCISIRRIFRQCVRQIFIRHFPANPVNVVRMIGPGILASRFCRLQRGMKGHPVGPGIGCHAAFSRLAFGRHQHRQVRLGFLGGDGGPQRSAAAADNQNIAINHFHSCSPPFISCAQCSATVLGA